MPVDWGHELDPLRLSTRSRTEVVESDDVEQLPDVVAARREGWEPLEEAPLWCFLPAIWPHDTRGWVPDRRVRTMSWANDTGASERLPWSGWTHASIEADYNALLASCGLPPRPAGRVWLLRCPDGSGGLEAVQRRLVDGWVASGGEVMVTPAFIGHCAEALPGVLATA